MLNSTILGLSTILLLESPTSISPCYGIRSFTLEKSHFSKSIHNLFYFNIFSGNASFSNTVFNDIMGGAIIVDSDYDAYEVTIEKRYAPNIMSSWNYSFGICMFRNCHVISEHMNGGAISINIPDTKDFTVELLLQSCSFYNCYAQGGQGGAIYAYRICNINIFETCFSYCFTREPSSTGDTGIGTAFYIQNINSTTKTVSRTSSYDQCPPRAAMFPNTETVFFINGGIANFSNSNFTKNVVETGSSAINFVEQSSASVKFSNFNDLIGESTIYFTDISDSKCEIIYSNFVECHNHSDSIEIYGIISVLQSSPIIESSVFINTVYSDKFLAFRNKDDSTSEITFNSCVFVLSEEYLYDISICVFNDCSFGQSSPSTNSFSFFNSQECWAFPPTPSFTPLPSNTPDPTMTPLPTATPGPTSNAENKAIYYMCICNTCILIILLIFAVVICIIIYKKRGNSLQNQLL